MGDGGLLNSHSHQGCASAAGKYQGGQGQHQAHAVSAFSGHVSGNSDV